MLVHCVLLTIIALKVLIAYPLQWSFYNMGLYIRNPTSIEFMRKRPIFLLCEIFKMSTNGSECR